MEDESVTLGTRMEAAAADGALETLQALLATPGADANAANEVLYSASLHSLSENVSVRRD